MFSAPDMAVIVAVALVILGPDKLPGLGRSLGKAIKDFREGVQEGPSAESKAAPENIESRAGPETRMLPAPPPQACDNHCDPKS